MASETAVNIGALQQRVLGIESSQQGILSSFNALQNRVETLFAGLSAKIEERSRTPWTVIWGGASVIVVFMSLIIGILYQPIRENQADFKLALIDMTKVMTSLSDKYVTIREVDARAVRTVTDIARIREDIGRLNNELVPRAEHAERWRAIELQFTNAQRQLDDMRKAFGDTFSLRDALIQMQRRIDMLEGKRPS